LSGLADRFRSSEVVDKERTRHRAIPLIWSIHFRCSTLSLWQFTGDMSKDMEFPTCIIEIRELRPPYQLKKKMPLSCVIGTELRASSLAKAAAL
jgi:hypothetical protein